VIPASTTKWGEEVDLMLHTEHGVALQAVLLVDDVEVARTGGIFDGAGGEARLDNTRCIADKRERVAAGRGIGGGAGGGGGTAVQVGVQVPSAPATTAQLELETDAVVGSTSLLSFRLVRPATKIVLRLWSIEPNDFDGVRIGVHKLAWRPNIPEAEYEAYLVRLEIEKRERAARAEAELRLQAERDAEARRVRAEQDRIKREAELRIRLEEQRQVNVCRLEAQRRARGENVPFGDAAHAKLCREVAEEDFARRRRHDAELAAEEQARLRAQAERARGEEEARRRAHELAIAAEREAEARRLQLELELERKRKREQFCASHPNDRDCWGPGGMKVSLELDAHRRESAEFCTTHHDDVRCWSDKDWTQHRSVWNERVAAATKLPSQPEGPPPAPLAEETPPKLSVHATWRPGYWHWLDGKWVWLAGQWRVPEEDIVAEQTTTAPDAPPPAKSEAPPPAPVASAVWVGGFWQWNGTSWVWIAGSYQLRPPQMSWRAPEWRARGSVHVLIPGGWIRIGGSR
jgi:hypothetical protein